MIEDALRRLAREEGLDDSKKASVINDDIRSKGRYGQPMWRQIQAWLDIGNGAAHGNFNAYTEQNVTDMLDGIERFLAQELH